VKRIESKQQINVRLKLCLFATAFQIAT